MNGQLFGMNTVVIAAVYLGLALFGQGFNALIGWMEHKGYLNGYTSLAVVVGVGVTLAALVPISPAFALISAGAFAASGTPMIVGSIWRHVRERERELTQLRDEALDERINWRNE